MIYAQKCDMYTYMYTRAFYMYFWALEVSVLFTWLLSSLNENCIFCKRGFRAEL